MTVLVEVKATNGVSWRGRRRARVMRRRTVNAHALHDSAPHRNEPAKWTRCRSVHSRRDNVVHRHNVRMDAAHDATLTREGINEGWNHDGAARRQMHKGQVASTTMRINFCATHCPSTGKHLLLKWRKARTTKKNCMLIVTRLRYHA